MIEKPLALSALNAVDREGFVQAIGFIFERSPWIAAAAWDVRPFRDREQLYRALCAIVDAADGERKLALIRAHPDLAGRAAVARELSEESTREQETAGLDRLTPDQFASFTRLNAAYRSRFDFPFVICVREHDRESILSAFTTRLAHARDREIDAALLEIAKIARLRLFDAVQE